MSFPLLACCFVEIIYQGLHISPGLNSPEDYISLYAMQTSSDQPLSGALWQACDTGHISSTSVQPRGLEEQISLPAYRFHESVHHGEVQKQFNVELTENQVWWGQLSTRNEALWSCWCWTCGCFHINTYFWNLCWANISEMLPWLGMKCGTWTSPLDVLSHASLRLLKHSLIHWKWSPYSANLVL